MMDDKNLNDDLLKKAFTSKLDIKLSENFDAIFFDKLKLENSPTHTKMGFFDYLGSLTGIALCAFACFLLVEQFNYSPEDAYLDSILAIEESLDREIFNIESTSLTSLELNEI